MAWLNNGDEYFATINPDGTWNVVLEGRLGRRRWGWNGTAGSQADGVAEARRRIEWHQNERATARLNAREAMHFTVPA